MPGRSTSSCSISSIWCVPNGQTARAVEEAIRICKDRNVLKEFLECHEKEAIDIMVQLFSQEEVLSDFLISQREEGRAEGEARGEEKKSREFAAYLKSTGLNAEQISDVVKYSADTVRSWLEFS